MIGLQSWDADPSRLSQRVCMLAASSGALLLVAVATANIASDLATDRDRIASTKDLIEQVKEMM